MPTPSRAPHGARLSRRAALASVAALAGGALVGCTPDRKQRPREAEPAPVEPKVDPDVAVAAEALANQERMIDLLTATGERHGRLVELLAPVVATHEAHAALLADAVPDEESPATSPSPSSDGQSSAGAATSPSPAPDSSEARLAAVAGNPVRALAQVAAAEQELTTATKRHAFRAQSGAFARILGSMAAGAAQHADVLASAQVGKGASS